MGIFKKFQQLGYSPSQWVRISVDGLLVLVVSKAAQGIFSGKLRLSAWAFPTPAPSPPPLSARAHISWNFKGIGGMRAENMAGKALFIGLPRRLWHCAWCFTFMFPFDFHCDL